MPKQPEANSELVRINKLVADKKLASRREADALIERGLVLVDGKPATIGQKVSPTANVTITSSKKTKGKQYFAYYKGAGIITHSPGEGEVDIATRLQKDFGLTDVYPVGRLDKASEGLMILTNDGRVTTELLDPEHGHEREYVVTVDKPMKGPVLKQMAGGMKIEKHRTKKAITKSVPNKPLMFHITLTEGKKHQIRRMCAALGYQVKGLKRVRIANIELGKLKPNQFRKLTGPELKTFLADLGIS